MKSERVCISLDKATRKKLSAVARSNGLSVSAEIRLLASQAYLAMMMDNDIPMEDNKTDGTINNSRKKTHKARA